MSTLRYVSGMLVTTTSCPSLASITPVKSTESVATVGDAASSLVYHPICLLPFSHALHFILPSCFSFINASVKESRRQGEQDSPWTGKR
eukprot:12304294-Ditylum_brightwellii.AAC.1